MGTTFTVARLRRYRPWIIGIICIVLFECGFFNLGFWRTTGIEQAHVGTAEIGAGLKKIGNGTYEVTDPETATITYPISGNNGQAIVVKSFRAISPNTQTSKDVQHISLAVESTDKPILKGGKTRTVWISGTDSDGSWGAPTRTLHYTSAPSTQYMLFGKKQKAYPSTKVCVTFLADTGSIVRLAKLEVNPIVPFTINPIRLFIEVCIALFFIAFRPGSRLYRTTFNTRLLAERICLIACLIIWSIFLFALGRLGEDPSVKFSDTFHHIMDLLQYQQLADSLIHGHTWLDLPVDPALMQMTDPYNFGDRVALSFQGHTFYWDHAYYDGHYYSYFGIVPALLAFVPFQLIMGRPMPTYIAVSGFAILACIFGVLLIRRIAKDYFPNISIATVWLITLAFLVGNSLLVHVFRPQFYDVPISCALALTYAGIFFWQISKNHNGNIAIGWLMVGSLCIALNLGTRPQFMVACFLALALFWQEIRWKRTLFSKSSIGITICAFAPFVVVAIPTLYYNYVRFGSFTNFGQDYNLTGFNMTQRQASPYFLPSGIFDQLFQPPVINGTFPFITTTHTGITAPNEPSLGGFFAIAPLALFALFIPLVRKKLRNMHALPIAAWALALGILVMAFDVYKAGSSMRYYADFSWLIWIAAIFVFFAMAPNAAYIRTELSTDAIAHENTQRDSLTGFAPVVYYRFWVISTVIAVALSYFIIGFGPFAPHMYGSFIDTQPTIYYTVNNWFMMAMLS